MVQLGICSICLLAIHFTPFCYSNCEESLPLKCDSYSDRGCDCEWLDWSSWSTCSKTCGGGTKSRTRFSKSQSCVSTCEQADTTMIDSQNCNTICYHGGSYHDNNCYCPDEYFGTCCEKEFWNTSLNAVLDDVQDRELNFHTPDGNGYVSLGGVKLHSGQTSFRFQVRAKNDAYVILHKNSWDTTNNIYKIILGGWENSASAIRTVKLGTNLAHYDNHALSVNWYHDFWVSWKDGRVSVGTGRVVGRGQFMAWTDPNPHTVHYISVGTDYGATGEWRIICPSKDHCTNVACDSSNDMICNRCEDQGADISHSVYWPDVTKKQCRRTCSWRVDMCWPGKCSDFFPSSCVCETGFKKNPSSATCDISTKADILHCKLSIEDTGGEIRQIISGTNSTGCRNGTNVYVNIRPVSISFHIKATFTREGSSLEPNYIQRGSTRLGIVGGKMSLFDENISGRLSLLNEIILKGGGDCTSPLNSTTPKTALDCQNKTAFTNREISNGHRISATINIFTGGSFKYTYFSGSLLGIHQLTPFLESKTLYFKYDDTPPRHCFTTSSCTRDPLHLSTRVTKSANVYVSVRPTDWFDPYPLHGEPDQASGVHFYKLEIYGMKHLNPNMLTVDYANHVFSTVALKSSDLVTVTLTDQPAMYAVYLEVHDVAGNVQYARRFLLYDNKSTVKVKDDKYIRVISAAKDTNYRWQSSPGGMQLTWPNRFYNDFYINNDLLVPIKTDIANAIAGIYDQQAGVLPVNGTENVNGVINFNFQWALNNGPRTPWIPVPDFANQSLYLDLNTTDGETYEIWVMAQDIMSNFIIESVVVHIDRSEATIANLRVTTTDDSAITTHHGVLIANNTTLNTTESISILIDKLCQNSGATIQFQAYDVHSGISSVEWTWRSSEKDSGVSSEKLSSINLDTDNCTTNIDCYCPKAGPCEFFIYKANLDVIFPRNDENTIVYYNRTGNITLNVINGAHLTTFVQLWVTVREMHRQKQSEGFWSTSTIAGVASACGVLVLIATVAVVIILRRRHTGKPTEHRCSSHASSHVNEGAEETFHIYSGLQQVRNPVYEKIKNHSSVPKDNIYENISVNTSMALQKGRGQSSIGTSPGNVYANTGPGVDAVVDEVHSSTFISPDNDYVNIGANPAIYEDLESNS